MPDFALATTDGGTTTISPEAIDALRNDLKGDLLLPGSAADDEARAIWNAMIDRRPGIVVACQGAPDVAVAVRFAATHGSDWRSGAAGTTLPESPSATGAR